MLMCREHEEAPSAQRQPQPCASTSPSPSLRGRDSQGPLLGVVKSSEDPQLVRVRSDREKEEFLSLMMSNRTVLRVLSLSPFFPSIPHSFNKTHPERLLGTSYELRAKN